MIAAIPSELKRNAYKTQISPEDLLKTENTFQLVQNLTLPLANFAKMGDKTLKKENQKLRNEVQTLMAELQSLKSEFEKYKMAAEAEVLPLI